MSQDLGTFLWMVSGTYGNRLHSVGLSPLQRNVNSLLLAHSKSMKLGEFMKHDMVHLSVLKFREYLFSVMSIEFLKFTQISVEKSEKVASQKRE